MRLIDGIYRYRVEGNEALLTAWKSASHVVADPKPAAKDSQRSGVRADADAEPADAAHPGLELA